MLNNKKNILILALAVVAISSTFFNSCVHAPYVLPVSQRTGDPNICFERDVLPIFQSNCAKSGCHDSHAGKSGYKLDSYANIIKKGIVPGNIAASKIWQSVDMKIFLGTSHMPVGGNALSPSELDVIKRWIETGAIDSGACSSTNCDTTAFTFSGSIYPLMQLHCVGCHNSPSSSGGSLMDYNSVKTAAVSGRLLGDIEHLAGYNAMPLGGSQLLDCQITQVKKWVAAGAPNN